MTHENETSSTLRNGLPPPPIPQRLREMLKDYPGHLERVQEVLNGLIEGPHRVNGPPYYMFEVATWVLESRLEAFIHEAKAELEAAQASGDPAVIAKAKEKDLLMGLARSSGGGMRGLHVLQEYFQEHREALK